MADTYFDYGYGCNMPKKDSKLVAGISETLNGLTGKTIASAASFNAGDKIEYVLPHINSLTRYGIVKRINDNTTAYLAVDRVELADDGTAKATKITDIVHTSNAKRLAAFPGIDDLIQSAVSSLFGR